MEWNGPGGVGMAEVSVQSVALFKTKILTYSRWLEAKTILLRVAAKQREQLILHHSLQSELFWSPSQH